MFERVYDLGIKKLLKFSSRIKGIEKNKEFIFFVGMKLPSPYIILLNVKQIYYSIITFGLFLICYYFKCPIVSEEIIYYLKCVIFLYLFKFIYELVYDLKQNYDISSKYFLSYQIKGAIWRWLHFLVNCKLIMYCFDLNYELFISYNFILIIKVLISFLSDINYYLFNQDSVNIVWMSYLQYPIIYLVIMLWVIKIKPELFVFSKRKYYMIGLIKVLKKVKLEKEESKEEW